MYILKNAWISIKRNKARNILIGIIILIVACACTVTLAIKNTAADLIDSYEAAYTKEATIGFDRAKMMQGFNPAEAGSREEKQRQFENIASYTVADVKNFADSEYVTDYYYTYSVGLNGGSIQKAEMSSDDAATPPDGAPKDFGGRGGAGNNTGTDFNLVGYSSLDAMSEFISGTYTVSEIADGAWGIAFNGDYVFINEELANYNNLKLNDKITLTDTDGATHEFEILGIFKENDTGEGVPAMFSGSANTIVTNADAVARITDANANLASTVSPTFVLNSYDDVAALQSEFYAKGLDENFVLQTNEAEAASGVSGVTNVNTFATTFLIITLIIGGVVLFVINMINIRERKYEIGVLRTIGMSKTKLTLQFVAELLLVALVALSLGAGLGAVSSKSVSNLLLASEIDNSNARSTEIGKNFGGDEMRGGAPEFQNDRGRGMPGRGAPVVQAYDSIDAVVDATVLLELLGIGVALVLISSIAAMVSIQRFSPLTILKERS